jgi:hypothetical protein
MVTARDPAALRLGPAAIVAVALPVFVALVLCVWWTTSGRLRLSGDEPHYLIMAASLVRDKDLDLQNNYVEDAVTGRLYGEMQPHAYPGLTFWPPYHSPGLAIFLALPTELAEVDGARIALILWAAAIPVALTLWLQSRTTPGLLLFVGAALALSVPMAFGGSQVYPDLPGAAIVLGAALGLIHWWEWGTRPAMTAWAATWVAVGFLPWVHLRFAGACAVLGTAGAAIAWRDGSARLRLLLGMGGAVALVAALAWFNVAHYGTPLGPPRWVELTDSPRRALMMLLGLHFDQSQGLFIQQPLWLLSLIGLGRFARAKPVVAAWLAVLYLTLILPVSLQLARFGGGGAAGRFGWAASFLWIVPLAHLLQTSGEAARRSIGTAIAAVVAVHVLSASWWVPQPARLVANLDADLWTRDSLFLPAVRGVLPSFYFWDYASYLTYAPNVLAMLAAVVLILGGVFWMDQPEPVKGTP